MLLGKAKMFYIQSTPPQRGVFVHHSHYAGLAGIMQSEGLAASKTGRGTISLTTDPGRFLNHLPMFGGCMVDGFVEFQIDNLIEQGYAIPCVYRTHNPELVEWAKENGHPVFECDKLPPEYKYVLRFVAHNEIFVRENEWAVLDKHLNMPDYKLYVRSRYYNRMLKRVRPHQKQFVFKLEDHPLLLEKKDADKVS